MPDHRLCEYCLHQETLHFDMQDPDVEYSCDVPGCNCPGWKEIESEEEGE